MTVDTVAASCSANLATTSRYLRRADLGRMREAVAGRVYRAVEAPAVAK